MASGKFFRGEGAGLAVVRAAAEDEDALNTALSELMDNSKKERVLQDCIPAEASLTGSPSIGGGPSGAYENRPGTLVVTSERLLFWCKDAAQGGDDDLSIEAVCIGLHAMRQDPLAVYIQMRSDTEESSPYELTFILEDEKTREEDSQALFQSLTQLINMHPIADDDGDDGREYRDDKSVDFPSGDSVDDCIIWTSPGTTRRRGKTRAERKAMMEKLDNMLVVPKNIDADGANQGMTTRSGHSVADHESEDGWFSDGDDDML